MKTIAALLIAIALVGCHGGRPSPQREPDTTTVPTDNRLVVYTDTETGCQYVKPSTSDGHNLGGIVPRMKSDGQLGMGCKDKIQ